MIVIGSLVAAPAAQADLVSVTLILAGVFFTSMAVNEVAFVEEDTTQIAQNTAENSGP
jgi:hypothetical protein